MAVTGQSPAPHECAWPLLGCELRCWPDSSHRLLVHFYCNVCSYQQASHLRVVDTQPGLRGIPWLAGTYTISLGTWNSPSISLALSRWHPPPKRLHHPLDLILRSVMTHTSSELCLTTRSHKLASFLLIRLLLSQKYSKHLPFTPYYFLSSQGLEEKVKHLRSILSYSCFKSSKDLSSCLKSNPNVVRSAEPTFSDASLSLLLTSECCLSWVWRTHQAPFHLLV